MNGPSSSAALEAAVAAARRAGELMLEYSRQGFSINHKGRTDLVTEADVACERAIIETIHAAYPNHAVVAEEGGQSGESSCRWIIDPIDGTTNFAHGFPVYCASIGFEREGQIAAGAVYDPTRGEMFTATRGGGAFLNGEAIRVSAVAALEQSLLATGFPYAIRDEVENNLSHFANFAMRAQAIRRPGAAALDLCYVACGRLDGFWEFHLKPWDMAAGALIVKEAGGRVTGVSGEPFSIYNPHILASNGRIHGEMLSTLQMAAK